MRVFILSPSPQQDWLSPEEAAARLRAAFQDVSIDAEAGQRLAEGQIAKYRQLFAKKGYSANSVEMMERTYQGALVVHAGDDEAHRFNAVIRHETGIYLSFDPGIPFKAKRLIATKAAAALGYRAEYSEEI